MVLDEAQQGKASSCACGIEGNWGEGWTNFSPILERICVSKLAISICEKLRIGNVVLRDVLTPSLFQFPLPACANMEATCYCQHAILQRTYSSYQQDEDRWLRWTNVVCFTSGLILIWAQFCRCFTSRHANEKHMSWTTEPHLCPSNPCRIQSVRRKARPTMVGQYQVSLYDGDDRAADRRERAVSDSLRTTSALTTPKYQAGGRPSFLTKRLTMDWEQVLGAPPLHCTCRTLGVPIRCRLLGDHERVLSSGSISSRVDNAKISVELNCMRCCCEPVAEEFVWKMREAKQCDWSFFFLFFWPQFSFSHNSILHN